MTHDHTNVHQRSLPRVSMKRAIRTRYEPVSLDLVSILPDSEKKHLDRYGYVISHLYEVRFLDNRWKELKRRSKKARKKQFTQLNAVILRRILDKRHSRRILRNLCDWDILEANNQYIVGKKSRSYRLTAKYADSEFRSVDYGRKFSDRLDRFESEGRATHLPSLHKEIAEQIERNFTIDMDVANKLMQKLRLDRLTAIRAKLALDRMKKGDFGHSVSGKTGRYFNHLINLKRELRQAIVCKDGSKLVDVDIANSQPFFLSVFLACIEREVADVMKVAEELKVDIRSLPKVSTEKEFKHFTQLTGSGTFYDYFCRKTGLTRGVVKDKMIQTFFKPMHYTTPFEEEFRKLFPKIIEVFKLLKPKGAHNKLALLLQRIESLVVIETLCDLMIVEEIPFIPIHDGVLVPRRYAAGVARVIRDTSYYYSRLKPSVRIKTLKGKEVVPRQRK